MNRSPSQPVKFKRKALGWTVAKLAADSAEAGAAPGSSGELIEEEIALHIRRTIRRSS